MKDASRVRKIFDSAESPICLTPLLMSRSGEVSMMLWAKGAGAHVMGFPDKLTADLRYQSIREELQAAGHTIEDISLEEFRERILAALMPSSSQNPPKGDGWVDRCVGNDPEGDA